MYEPLRRRTLALLKVPLEPHPPMGNPASLRVFRAGKNYFRLQLAGWAFTQIVALAGIIFWTAILLGVELAAHSAPFGQTHAASPTVANPAAPPQPSTANWATRAAENVKLAATTPDRGDRRAHGKRNINGWAGFKQAIAEIVGVLPSWVIPWIWALKIFGLLFYLLQIPFTYALRRLDYEMRWYMVTDRSLRLREGIWNVSEATMSFANLQQVVVSQGPLQRLLGMADVKVQSAGGGATKHEGVARGNMHLGLFHNVTNAPEIRDLILERLRRFRESGLGDPEEHVASASVAARDRTADSVAAARELLVEARALRQALG